MHQNAFVRLSARVCRNPQRSTRRAGWKKKRGGRVKAKGRDGKGVDGERERVGRRGGRGSGVEEGQWIGPSEILGT